MCPQPPIHTIGRKNAQTMRSDAQIKLGSYHEIGSYRVRAAHSLDQKEEWTNDGTECIYEQEECTEDLFTIRPQTRKSRLEK